MEISVFENQMHTDVTFFLPLLSYIQINTFDSQLPTYLPKLSRWRGQDRTHTWIDVTGGPTRWIVRGGDKSAPIEFN